MIIDPDIERFPHMLAGDIALWRKWLNKYGTNFQVYLYDLHVGAGVPILPGTLAQYRLQAEISSKKRIDVVARRAGEIYIIEVKPYASLSAIGQVLCYSALYKKEFNPTERVIPCIVTDYVYADEAYLFKFYGIEYYSVLEI
jgi:hypothetical protein